MKSFDESLPAYATWQMFYDNIIPPLISPNSAHETLVKLSKLIKTKQFVNVFVCPQDDSTFDEYATKSQYYTAFIVWFLGKFYYLLHYENLISLYDTIVDVHWYILNKMFLWQPHIYQEITTEYLSAAKQLFECYKNLIHSKTKNQLPYTIKVFSWCDKVKFKELNLTSLVMEITSPNVCFNMLTQTLQLIYKIMKLNISMGMHNKLVDESFEFLLEILQEGNFNIKCPVLEIYADLLKRFKFDSDEMPPNYVRNFHQVVSAVDSWIKRIYINKRTVRNEKLERFEKILIALLCDSENLEKSEGKIKRMGSFLIDKNICEELRCISLQKACPTHLSHMLKNCQVINRQMQDMVEMGNYGFMDTLKQQILNEIIQYIHSKKPKNIVHVVEAHASRTWIIVHDKFESFLLFQCLEERCQIINTLTFVHNLLDMMIYINIEVQNYCISHNITFLRCSFFNELKILTFFLKIINTHMDCCPSQNYNIPLNELVLKTLSKLPISYSVTCITFVFNCIAYSFNKAERGIKETSLSTNKEFRELTNIFWFYLLRLQFTEEMSSVHLHSLVQYISLGFIRLDIKTKEFEALQDIYTRAVKRELEKDTMYVKFASFPPVFTNRDVWILQILLPALVHRNYSVSVKAMIIKQLKIMVCSSSSQYVLSVSLGKHDKSLSYECYCLTCINNFDTKKNERNILTDVINRTPKSDIAVQTIFKLEQPLTGDPRVLNSILQTTFELYDSSHAEVRNEISNSIFSFSHIPAFHTTRAIRLWIKLLKDDDRNVQRKIASKIHLIFQRQTFLTEEEREKMWNILFYFLEIYGKRAFETESNFSQESILVTLENIAAMKVEYTIVHIINLLLHFIILNMSAYQLKATATFIEIARANKTNTGAIYYQYKTEFNQTVVRLCVVNHMMDGTGIVASLDRLTLSLGYTDSRIFIAQECRYFLPVLMPLFVINLELEVLIEELAEICETNVRGLLMSKFGNIFLHIFLHEEDTTHKKCMNYIQERTESEERHLSIRNFQAILHELLLNFHDKRTEVLKVIQSLIEEQPGTFSIEDIPAFLHPKFLGVLAYFDMKLIGNYAAKNKVLLSLADLLVYMGPKYITPLRFKILAMLTTSLSLTYNKYPELNCDVWVAFIKTCEIAALGPQLASIFVSLAPLADQNPDKIFQIFKYLVIDNEKNLKNHICDLFFIVESNINYEICIVVKKYLQEIEQLPFRDQLQTFLKYLKHETIEVRIHGFQYIKKLFEKNREPLHRLTLGVNGIDPLILEFIDIMMHTCCEENDTSLKLACGECIGELGAIEPTHLPQKRKVGEDNVFVFFITEDGFIINVLKELTRALHSEKHTQSMDRFALAIQEILKMHGISPDVTSPKHAIWINFPEHQRELMMPLLSSRYTMAYSVDDITVSPIYGSTLGSSFKTWIYHWTVKLVLTVTGDKKKLLKLCLPSLKQDYRTLMQFLPHILVHALLEGDEDSQYSIYTEVMTIINSVYITSESQKLEDNPEDSEGDTLQDKIIIRDGTLEHECGKVIFILLDFLDRWIREWKWKHSENLKEHKQHKVIEEFLMKFSKVKLARCNFLVGEFAGALMQLEEYLKSKPKELPNQFSFLVKLYTQMSDADGVAGVTALQSAEPPIEQRLLSYLLSGKLADATACYEQTPTRLRPCYIQGLVRCYLDMENTNTALFFTEGVLEKQPQLRPILLETQAEPLWRLSRYDELDTLLQQPELARKHSWDIQIGRALVHFRKEERREFKSILDSLRILEVDYLGSASLQEGIYNQGYTCVAKLHIISELEQVEQMMHELLIRPNDPNVCKTVIKNLISEWDFRLKLVEESVRVQEPILCLRRVAIEQAKNMLTERVPHALPYLNKLLGESWLLSASIARAAGMQQQAYTFILKAEEYKPHHLFLEKAKLQWFREDHEQALTTLKRGIAVFIPEKNISGNNSVVIANLSTRNKKLVAKARLLIASYNDNLSNVDVETNIQHYKEAVEVYKEWERSLVCLAQYYDRVFRTLSDNDKDVKGSDIQIHMLNYFGKSLLYGNKYIYQSMPRLLSIWFDCGTRLLDLPAKDNRNNTLLKLTKMVDMYLERLPVYVFYTAFSQLVSRICHPQKQVYMELKSIIIKLILKYPQQSLWNIMSVVKSSYLIRNKRCSEILNDSRLKTSTMNRLVTNFTTLAEKLIELCNKEVPENVQHTTVNSLLRSLPRLLSKDDFSQIMVPIEKFRKLILPNPDFPSAEHNPFPNHYVYITGIENEVVILFSLQRPRKITFRGSDGQKYVQMLKPKDDLRKDFRLMEFNDIVNQMLSWEADSRQRRLYIRLYSVVPLNEECGLIEWIPNLIGLRPILVNLYHQSGLGMRGRELKQYCSNYRDTLAKKRDIYLNTLLPKHPPVLSDWFRKAFPDAQSWLIARDSYVRTTAVMSMVGYILGLGDRHGENILFDSTTGDTVHVDFNCLFNKGETFEWPERVPFRLTHNMVAALGPLGVEGAFRKSCASTLKVLRAHTTTLMSIITPFVYDPLVSWPRNVASAQQAQTSERTNEQAVEHVRNIEQRLQGIVRIKGKLSIPLSVEGQTNHIIQEATSIDNLCQMYVGWGPFM